MIRKEEVLLFNAKNDLDKYISEQPDRIQRVRRKTEEINQHLRRLVIMYHIEELNPVELRDKLEQIDYLRGEGQALLTPLNNEMESIKRFEKTVQANLKEYRQLSEEGVLLQEGRVVLGEYLNRLRHLLDLAATARQLNAIAPNSVKDVLLRLDNKREEVEKDLLRLWKTYFLRPLPVYYFSVTDWRAAYSNTKTWIGFVPYWHIPLKENWEIFRKDFIAALAVSIVMIGAGFLLLGRLGRKYLHVPVRRHLLPALIWLSLGLPAYAMIMTCGLSQFGIFRFPAGVMITGGIVSLAWRMRMLVPGNGASARHNILWPLWWIFAVTIASMAGHFPSLFFAPVRALMLVAGGLYLFFIRKEFHGDFDRKSGTFSVWLLFALSAVSLSKWGNIATLIATAWFILLLNVEIATNVVRIMDYLNQNDKENFIVRNIINGIVFPLILIASLSGSAAWLCMFIGGLPLLNQIIHWRVNFGLFGLNLSMVIIIVAVFFVVRSLIFVLNRAVGLMSLRREEIQLGTVKSVQAILSYIIWCLYIFFSLNLLGVKLEHIALIAGGLSIGVGFGLQDMIKNFFSGLILLFGRSIHPGDEVQIEDVRGTVQKVNIRNTIVQTNDDSTTFIPNADLAFRKITNWTYRDPKGRAEIIVGVAYGSATDHVRKLLIESALAHPQVLKDPPPYVLFQDFGTSALVFHLRFWIKNLIQQRDRVASAIRFEIDRIFREQNIEIAVPQQDIHIRSVDLPDDFHIRSDPRAP